MRIGLFTDTYRPSINGIVFVVESLKIHLEGLGHEVYIFCPARSIRPSKHAEVLDEDEHVIRFPSVKSGFFDDFDLSLFFPPIVISRIKELDLDIVHVFTPSQVGLVGIQAAYKHNIPFVVQHSTDLYEFSENYPNVLPGSLALASIILPMTIKLDGKDFRELAKLYRPRRGAGKWNKDIIAKGMTILYSRADAVIALSRKSKQQLESWQYDEESHYAVDLLPSGVDAIPAASEAGIRAFKKQFSIADDDEVYGFVGRLGEEKNLDILIEALPLILRERPHARLLFVGDFDYRKTLERLARRSGHGDRVTFTGSLPREDLGLVYGTYKVFVFPSLKDTQGWVLHEAAHAGLPIVLIDTEVSEVVKDGKNGYFAQNTASDIAHYVVELLSDDDKRKRFGAYGQQLAQKFNELSQTKKIVTLYHRIMHSVDSK
ncbi:MAG: glycosyltransferase [Candidatus Saccharimonadales bacterium]